MGLGAHTQLHPGELLTAQLGNDAFDAVVAPGRAVGPDPESAGLQGNVVKQDDDPLGRHLEKGAELQNGPAGQVHIGQGLQQIQPVSVVVRLAVEPLKFGLVHPNPQLFRQQVQAAKAHIVPGFGVFGAGIAQTHNEPAVAVLHQNRSAMEVPPWTCSMARANTWEISRNLILPLGVLPVWGMVFRKTISLMGLASMRS